MGRATRHTPKLLAKKLKLIRMSLKIETFEEMIGKLGVEDEVKLYRSAIHEYENGRREPPLIVLLRYSQLAGITINDLVDDQLELRLSKTGRLSAKKE